MVLSLVICCHGYRAELDQLLTGVGEAAAGSGARDEIKVCVRVTLSIGIQCHRLSVPPGQDRCHRGWRVPVLRRQNDSVH